MNNSLMDALYIEHNEKFGVLSANSERMVTRVLGTDLTLVHDKREGKAYVLVPLTKNHTFKAHVSPNGKDSIEVDGKVIKSDNFFRKDACQWIEIDKDTLSKVA